MAVSALVSIDEVFAEINDVNEADTDAGELQGFIDAITEVVEEITGPVLPDSRTETHDGGQPVIMLRAYPVLTVESVTEYSPAAQVLAAEPYGTTTFTGYGYRLEADIGRLTRTSGGIPRSFACGTGNIAVSYTVGRATVPPGIRNAALELIRLHWQPQQSGNVPGAGDDDNDGQVILGYFVPRKVLDLLGPQQRAPRVA